MPINMSDSPLSSIKIGENNILKGYVGEGQIFPNSAIITAAAFVQPSTPNTGGNESYVVSGDIGSSFTLTGSSGATGLVGTQILSVSPTTYQIAIADQSTVCGAPVRNAQILITPIGSTVLSGSLSNTDTISQAAGPAIVTNTVGFTISVVNTLRYTIVVGGQLRWAAGSKFGVTVNFTTAFTEISKFTIKSVNSYPWTVYSALNPYGVAWTNTTSGTQPAYGAYWNSPDTSGNTLGSGTYSLGFELTAAEYPNGLADPSFQGLVANAGCYQASPSSDSNVVVLYP